MARVRYDVRNQGTPVIFCLIKPGGGVGVYNSCEDVRTLLFDEVESASDVVVFCEVVWICCLPWENV